MTCDIIKHYRLHVTYFIVHITYYILNLTYYIIQITFTCHALQYHTLHYIT